MNGYPKQEEFSAMSEEELHELWKKLIRDCTFDEGTIASRALAIGFELGRR